MAGLGVPELLIILVVALLLFGGYKKLPDASRSLGRSLRIFKGEMKGMKDDDSAGGGLSTKDAAQATPVRGEITAPAPSTPAAPASGDLTAQLHEEARVAEARAAELRARAEQTRAADGTR
jgi:sec-independent protein translocase protein TatA